MSIEAYQNNATLRQHYYKINDIQLVEIEQDPEDELWYVWLCREPDSGWKQDKAFDTEEQARLWCQRFCPELV